ncbi:hypothetical protein KP509_04G020600 [Ceratopteris richardii]|nr:hypothetical protein KP509_04G020600 [Ceratopteris richardii]
MEEEAFMKIKDTLKQELASLESHIKKKKQHLKRIGGEALDFLFQQYSSWGWNLVNKNAGRNPGDRFGQAHINTMRNPLLDFEAEVCSAWSDRGSTSQRLLFAGSQFEVFDTDLSTKEFTSLECAQVCSIKHLIGNEVHGPLYYGQRFEFSIEKDSESEDSELLTGAFTLMDDITLQMGAPVVLDGYTYVKFTMTGTEEHLVPKIVKFKSHGGGAPGFQKWLEVACNIQPSCLQENAVVLSNLMPLDLKKTSARSLKELLRRPFKEWYSDQSLQKEAALKLENFYIQCDTNYTLDEAVAKACASVYNDDLKKWLGALGTFIDSEICSKIRINRSKQCTKQTEVKQQEWDSTCNALLAEMKSQVLISKIRGDKKKHIKLEKIEVMGHSIMNAVKQKIMGGTKTLKLSFSSEELETHTFTWFATEFGPNKNDVDALMGSNSCSKQALRPVSGSPFELTSLDPNVSRLIDAVTLKDGQVLLLEGNNIGEASLHLYLVKLGVPSSKTSIRKFRRGHDLRAFDEASRILALYDKSVSAIHFFRFMDDKYNDIVTLGELQLSDYADIRNIIWVGLVPGKREMLLVDDEKRLCMYEFTPHQMMMRHWHTILPAQLIKAFITPDALCFVVICALIDTENKCETIEKNRKDGLEEMFAVVYLLDDSFTELKRLPLGFLSGRNTQDWHLVCKLFGPQLHLVILSSEIHSYVLVQSYLIDVSSPQQKYQLHAISSYKETRATVSDGDRIHDVPCNESLAALNYIYHGFDKYAVSPLLCQERRTLSLIFLLCPPFHGWEDNVAKRNCENHVKSYIQSLEGKGKVFRGLDLKLMFKALMRDGPLEEILSAQKQNIGDSIQKLLSLVPIQVARAENNMLRLMIDGFEIPSNVQFSDVVSLASVLRFGAYDLLLESWKGRIKVISSMGKQSSGKSYLLNHLAGSLFDVAGGRCTDGVWMTVRWDSEYMYVLLDFEGLGSFERSDQEDMLLSILSAAISNVTIFNKKDFHMDKETEAIFQRFQHGVNLVKADDKLFKGVFYIAVKDVDCADVEDLKNEFFQKLTMICNRTSENFLVRMYDGQICILAFPPFQRQEYHFNTDLLASEVREMDGQYASSRRFLQDFKLVLSQISAQDWCSMDSTRIMMRTFVLKNHLESAITLGQCNGGEELVMLDNDEIIVDDPIHLESETCKSFQLTDSGLELAVNRASEGMRSMDDIKELLRTKFQDAVQREDGSEGAWHASFQRFLNSLMERRQKRVIEWLMVNTEEFKEHDDVKQLILDATTTLVELKDKVLLCKRQCSKCLITCVLLKGHHSDHSCLGTHICSQECTFCREEQAIHFSTCTEPKIMECSEKAGHSGNHDCHKRTHSCPQTCNKYEQSSNCYKKCSLRVNHEGEHICKSPQHMCREKCSLPGCENQCNIPFESEHDQHVCNEKFCPVQCLMPHCTRQCATEDHFHLLKDDAQHFCSSEHLCDAKCEARGVCNVVTELVKQTKVFHGKRGDFEYDFVSEQSEFRKGCCVMIPAFTSKHSGPHLHSLNTNVIHYCDVRCPNCEYYCQLPFGHAGLHDTQHGNMKKSRFVADTENIDFHGRQYVRGESGVAEMCAMYCRARGRGHTHLIPCPERSGVYPEERKVRCTEKVYDGAKHLTKKEQRDLGEKDPLDQMMHATYWEYIGFKDPCDKHEGKFFALCDHYCPSEEHNDAKEKSYCTETLWHNPVPRDTRMGSTRGYVSEDGHHFSCTHTTITPHNVIFVVDKSYSMDSGDIKPKLKMFPQNRLGCVYDAMLRFITLRLQDSGRVREKDIMSVVLFGSDARIQVELKPISESLINDLPPTTDGCTNYSSGLEKAELILDKSRQKPEHSSKTPVIIFLSDGENNDGSDPVSKVRGMKRKNSRLVVHTIMFGDKSSGGILKDMASAGGGEYQLTLDDVELSKSFEYLAKSLKPRLFSLCNL